MAAARVGGEGGPPGIRSPIRSRPVLPLLLLTVGLLALVALLPAQGPGGPGAPSASPTAPGISPALAGAVPGPAQSLLPTTSASLSASPTTVNVGQSVTFTATYTPNSGYGCLSSQPDWCIFYITFGDGGSYTSACIGNANSASTTYSYSNPGTYSAGGSSSYVEEYSTLCSGSPLFLTYFNTVTITVNSLPLSGTAAASPTTTDVGRSITFTGTASGGTAPYAYQWRFGDGGSGSGATTTYAYVAAGNYIAWLWINDSASGRVTANVALTINALPVATGSATPDPTDVGVSASFSASGTGGTSTYAYAWAFGDGSVSSTQNPTHAYAAAGPYTARCWVNDTVGGSGSTTVSITVNALPTVVVSGTPGVADAGMPIAFTAAGTGGTGAIAYAWSFADGGRAGNNPTPSHVFNASGNYSVRAWANDSVGGSGSSTFLLTLHPVLSVPVLSATPAPTDANVAVSFSATFGGGTPSYITVWKFGDGGTSGSATASHTYTQAGTYTARFWVNDSVGGSQSATQQVVVAPDPSIVAFQGVFHPGAAGILDQGQLLNITATETGGTGAIAYAYAGLPNGCLSQNVPTITCRPSAAGVTNITVTVTDALGQSATAALEVTVNPALRIPSFAPSATKVDATVGITIQATTQGGSSPLTYLYAKLPAGCTPSDTPALACVPTTAGTYPLEVQATDAAGASAFANSSLTVDPLPTITGFFATPQNATVQQLVSFQVVALPGTGTLDYTYSGLPGGCSTSDFNGSTGSCTVTASGTYTVHVMVTDADGRSANDTVVLVVAPTPGLLGLGGSSFLWILLLALAVVVAVVVLLLVMRRRRSKQAAYAQGVPGQDLQAPAPVAAGPYPGGPAPGPEAMMYPSDAMPYGSDGYPTGEVPPGAPGAPGLPPPEGYDPNSADQMATAPWPDPQGAGSYPPPPPDAAEGAPTPPVQPADATWGPPPPGVEGPDSSMFTSAAPSLPASPAPGPAAGGSTGPQEALDRAPTHPASPAPAEAPSAPAVPTPPPPEVPLPSPTPGPLMVPPSGAPPAPPVDQRSPPSPPPCLLCGRPTEPGGRCPFCGFSS